MDEFAPANLSPLPIPPRPCALPGGLTWEHLQPCLPGFVAGGRPAPKAFASHEKQGLHGGANSRILTLRYPSDQRQVRSQVVFVKHADLPSKWESEKYRIIAAAGVPTPRLLASVHGGSEETIVLEFLETIGIDFQRREEADDLVRLVARVNAVSDPSEVFVPTPGAPQAEFEAGVHAALQELSHEPTLDLKVDVPRWFQAYRTAHELVEAMPLALNHGELYFQQVGWARRGDQRTLVIFDLESMARLPRLTDIAGILDALAARTGRDERELFALYLESFAALTGQQLPPEEAFRELRLVRLTGRCAALPWLLRDMQPRLAYTARRLHDDLTSLGLVPR